MRKINESSAGGIAALLVMVAVVVVGFAWGIPKYNVWRAGLSGEALLKKAEHEKQVMIETAKAELEAAALQAEAIEIVGEMAKKYPEYRDQQFIAAFGEAINNGSVKMIFVPTEGNIPLLLKGGSRSSVARDDDQLESSGPYCEHWRDPRSCDRMCECGHPCRHHVADYGANNHCTECYCKEFEEKENDDGGEADS